MRVALDQATAVALQSSGAVEVVRTESSDFWLLRDVGQIGVIRAGDQQIVIKPKVKIDRLIFMMGYAQNPNFWRSEVVRLDPDVDLTGALAESFRRLTSKALEPGLLKGYVQIDESSAVLRGRIREADQLRRGYGRLIPLEISYDDFIVDIAENQILLSATRQLLRLHGISTGTRRGLHRIAWQLADVTQLRAANAIPVWSENRLNARYVSALRVAELILQGRSFEQRCGALSVSGFVFSMSKIFEDFVCKALSETLAAAGGRSETQYRTHLDTRREVAIRPDFVWTQGGPRMVVDAKYKAEKPAGFPQADLYQLLAYCTVLGLRDGHLIYARGNEDARVHEVAGSGVKIHCHTLDLEDTPQGLLQQVASHAAAMQALTH